MQTGQDVITDGYLPLAISDKFTGSSTRNNSKQGDYNIFVVKYEEGLASAGKGRAKSKENCVLLNRNRKSFLIAARFFFMLPTFSTACAEQLHCIK